MKDTLLHNYVGEPISIITKLKSVNEDSSGAQVTTHLSYVGGFMDFDEQFVLIELADKSHILIARNTIAVIEYLSVESQIMSDPDKPSKGEMS